jgi:ketopantoate reductase
MRSYTVIGAGAVGLLYGTRLAAAGHPVRWVVRTGADEIARRGVVVRSEGRELRIDRGAVEVFADPAEAPASDTVIVALKTTANHALARSDGRGRGRCRCVRAPGRGRLP